MVQTAERRSTISEDDLGDGSNPQLPPTVCYFMHSPAAKSKTEAREARRLHGLSPEYKQNSLCLNPESHKGLTSGLLVAALGHLGIARTPAAWIEAIDGLG